jgi:hypothetical protein
MERIKHGGATRVGGGARSSRVWGFQRKGAQSEAVTFIGPERRLGVRAHDQGRACSASGSGSLRSRTPTRGRG